MESKILFLDLDGTLLNDNKRVSPENQQALDLAVSRGHKVVLASGRPLRSVLIQADRLRLTGFNCYIVACNGAILYDLHERRELSRTPLAFEDLYALFDEAHRRNVYIQTYDQRYVLVERRNSVETVKRYCSAIDMEFRMVDNVQRELFAPPVKALMIDYDGRAKTEPMRKWIVSKLSGRVDAFFSSPYYLEAVAAGVNKGRAVEELCALLNIPTRNAVAVGDEANDIAMLEAAGISCAMKNAQPELRSIADYVTRRDNNHDGVAEIVYHFLLE